MPATTLPWAPGDHEPEQPVQEAISERAKCVPDTLTGDICDAAPPSLGYTGAVHGIASSSARPWVRGLSAWCGDEVSAFHRTTAAAIATCGIFARCGDHGGLRGALRRGTRGKRFGSHLRPVDDPWPRPGQGGGRLALGACAVIALFAAAITGTCWASTQARTVPPHHQCAGPGLRPLNAALLLAWMLAGIGYRRQGPRAPLSGHRRPDPAADTPIRRLPRPARPRWERRRTAGPPGATGLLTLEPAGAASPSGSR